MERIICTMLLACTQPTSPTELEALTILADELTIQVSKCTQLRSVVLDALSSNDLQEPIRGFVGCKLPTGKNGKLQTCATSFSVMRHNLASAMVSMILASALTVQKEDVTLDHSLAMAFLEKQRQLSRIQVSCAHPPPLVTRSQSVISIFEQECTQPGSHLQDWRERISSELERQNFYQRDTIIRAVSQICQDLENRCENVEEPLRLERQKVVELETTVTQLRGQIANLEASAMDQRLLVDGLEAERVQMESNLDQTAEENERLRETLEQLKLDLSHANRNAEETLQAANESFNAKEVELRTTISRQEITMHQNSEIIRDLNETVKTMRESIEKFESEVRDLVAEREALKSTLEKMESDAKSEREALRSTMEKMENDARSEREVFRSTVKKMEGEAASERELRDQLEEELARRKANEATLSENIQIKKEAVQDLSDKLESLQLAHANVVKESEATLQALEVRYENNMTVVSAKVGH